MGPRPGVSAGSASALLVAIENYDHHPRLENLAAGAFGLADALEKAGIVNAFPQGLNGGTSQELASGMRLWFEQAGPGDRLFFYWCGHGKREADGHYLITQDSPPSNFDQSNAVEPRSLAKITANSKAKKILLVLDACFSGEALGEMIGTISSVLGGQAPNVGRGRGIAVLG
jgi:Caspase domain